LIVVLNRIGLVGWIRRIEMETAFVWIGL